MSRFSESDTEAFYDAEDALYRSFWDAEGSLHWGIFGNDGAADLEDLDDDKIGKAFLSACRAHNVVMQSSCRIDETSHVLDIGCGNGNTLLWLSGITHSRVTGIDISGVRIENAIRSMPRYAPWAALLRFQKASATDLPFDDGTFTHVWSQATIYHVHDKAKALQEAYRVLQPGGVFVFDDLIKPKPDVSDETRTWVYDRLLFDTDFSFYSYQESLRDTGFRVLAARDLSHDLAHSYYCLSRMAGAATYPEHQAQFGVLANAYVKMVDAVRNDELGWAQYRCVK